MPRNTAARKIGNGVISFLRQLQRHSKPVHKKFSSLSNTTVVAIFPNLCSWRRSLYSNVGGIDPEKLYRATLSNDWSSIGFDYRTFNRRTPGLKNKSPEQNRYLEMKHKKEKPAKGDTSDRIPTYNPALPNIHTPQETTHSAIHRTLKKHL